MEKKGTLLGLLFGFFKDDLKDFCGGVAKLCAETSTTAVGGAGLAVAGALLTENQREETETNRLMDGWVWVPGAYNYSHPAHDCFHPAWEVVGGGYDPMQAAWTTSGY